MLIGYTGDPTRFTTASRYAAYTGTAPIEFSSGGLRRPPAVPGWESSLEPPPALRRDHPDPAPPQPRAAVAMITHKLADGHTPREAIRSLKHQLSDVVWRHLIADAERSHRRDADSGPGQDTSGNDLLPA